MPIPILRKAFAEGFDSVPFIFPLLRSAPWLALLALVKWYFAGAHNPSERDMHGKVVLVTVSSPGQCRQTKRTSLMNAGRHERRG